MESTETPESNSNVYLYGPSKGEAIRLGLGNWFERLSACEEVRTVDRPDLVAEGVFISFNPIRTREDAFPQLAGRARKWICIEDDDSFVEACRIAKKEGVDRLIHTRLMDEMRCPVIPSAILLLMDRGIWLPDTDSEPCSFQVDEEFELGPLQERLLWLVHERGEADESERVSFLQIAGDLLANIGWEAHCLAVDELKERALELVASRMVFTGQGSRNLLGLASIAGKSGAGLAICHDWEMSPIRFSRLGSMFPRRLPNLGGKLRDTVPQLLSFVEESAAARRPSEIGQRRDSPVGTISIDDVLRMQDRFLDTSRFWDHLQGCDGDQLVEWCGVRIEKDSRYRYSPLYYAVQYFEAYPGFQLLCDENLLSEKKTGIERIQAMLEMGLNASGGYGAMFALYLGWCHILLGDKDGPHSTFQRLAGPQFSAVSGYVGELALALWYKGDIEQARACIDYADSLCLDREERPLGMIGARCLLGESAESFKLNRSSISALIESEDWVPIATWALVWGDQERVLIQSLEERAPAPVKRFFDAARNRIA